MNDHGKLAPVVIGDKGGVLRLPPVLNTYIVIPGVIGPKGSRTFFGKGKSVDNSKRGNAWTKHALPFVLERADTIPDHYKQSDTPVILLASYVFPQFKTVKRRWPVSRTSHGDKDKLDRRLFDALVDGGMLKDDSYIIGSWSHKRFAREGETPHVYVEVCYGEAMRVHERVETFVREQHFNGID